MTSTLFFWQHLAVPVAGFIALAIGMLVLVRREPNTRVRSYVTLAAVVGLGTLLAGSGVEASFDRQWAINRADNTERVLSQPTTPALTRLLTMPTAAHAALNVGRTERATHWAQELLDMARGHENDQGYGSAIHDGNIVLGRIAVESGDIEAGKQHLLAAGNTPGSCTLNSFGPDMLLAQELLARGETDTVLQYLDQCGAFWHRSELQQWKGDIARGEMPDFEGHFHY